MTTSTARPPGTTAGVPLSIKLILTTSILVSAAVFASAFFGQQTIEQLAQADAASRRAEGLDAIERESRLLAKNVATAVSIPLGSNQFSDIPPLLEDARRDYTRIQWLMVVDQTGRVVAATEGAPASPGAAHADPMSASLEAAAPGAVERAGAGTYGTAVRIGAQVIGQLRIGVSTADLERALAESLADAAARAAAARRTIMLVSLLVLAGGVLLAALEGLRMTRPLKLLAHQAALIAGGHFDQRVPENRRDEIGTLARNFNFMAGRIGELLAENAEKASLEREMSLARQVQQAMLPPDQLVVHAGVRIVGHCVPASTCGGDWWTYRKLSGGRTLLVIGDATGHGMHSAMIAATARGAVEALADADERLVTPEQVLRAIHAAISGVGDHAMLMTCFAAVLDPGSGTLFYANAGQNFPYVLRRSRTGALDQAQIIAASGNPLGDPNVPQSVRRGAVPMRPGDVLVTFTDGVVERSNPSGKLFGDRRLCTVFHGVRADTPDDLLALRARVVQAIDEFAAGTDAQDDVTLALMQLEPSAAQDRRAGTGS